MKTLYLAPILMLLTVPSAAQDDPMRPASWSSIETATVAAIDGGLRIDVADPARRYGNASVPITADWLRQTLILDLGLSHDRWYVAIAGPGVGFTTLAEGDKPGQVVIDPSSTGLLTGPAKLALFVGAAAGEGHPWVVVKGISLRPKPAVILDTEDADLTRVREVGISSESAIAAARIDDLKLDLPMRPTTPGRFVMSLPAALPPGAYLVSLTGPKTVEKRWLRVRATVLECDRFAYPDRPMSTLRLTLRDPSGHLQTASSASAHLDAQSLKLRPAGLGQWDVDVTNMKPGTHHLHATAGPATLDAPIYVSRGDFLHVSGTRFRDRSGHVFVPLGSEGGGSIRKGKQPRWSPFSSWPVADDATMDAHCAYLAGCGMNVLRIGLDLASGCLDTGDGASFPLAVRLARMLDAMGRHGLRAQIVLYWGPLGMYGFNERTAPGYAGTDDWCTGPESRRRQRLFLQDITRLFASDDRIFAWEVQNEFAVSADLARERPRTEWVHFVRDDLHRLDPNHPVGISYLPWASDPNVDPVAWAKELGCDFFQLHYGLGAEWYAQLRRGQTAGRPFLPGEFGTSRAEEVCEARITRDCLWLALMAGCAGAIGWHQDWVVPEEYRVPARLLARYRWLDDEQEAGPEGLQVEGRYFGACYRGRRVVVAYLSNQAASRKWEGYGGPIEYRDPQPTPLKVGLDLPAGRWTVRIHDAATGDVVGERKAEGTFTWTSEDEARDLILIAQRR